MIATLRKQWAGLGFLLIALLVACVPTEVEPGAAVEVTRPQPTPAPIPVEDTPTSSPTPPPTASIDQTLRPEEAPATLPIYLVERLPVAASGEAALAWAQSFGLANAVVADQSDERVRVISEDAATGKYEELTFLNTVYESVVVYSAGSRLGVTAGPSPTPVSATPARLSAEAVTSAAREFVQFRNLLPEPVIAHELPSADNRYAVRVSFAPAGLRFTAGGEPPGVTVYLDDLGRVVEARIIQASFTPAEEEEVLPLEAVYLVFTRNAMQPAFYSERAQLGGLGLDPLRFQAYSTPYGAGNDRVELVYAPVPTQPDRIVPMWLVTRPLGPGWEHYAEIYLPAIGGVESPRPIPTRTPLAHAGVTPTALQIFPSIIVDGEQGRLYGNAAVDGIAHTVSLDASTRELSLVFGLTGDLALDRQRGLLFVDKHPHGLTVIETASGEPVNDIEIPTGAFSQARPHADPATGNVLLFRDQMLLIADPLSPTWQQTVPFTVESKVCEEPLEQPATIEETWFDPAARLLYLSFVDNVCTPWITFTMVVFDLETMQEVARYPELQPFSGAAAGGRFYGKSWFRLGKSFQWAWLEGQPWIEMTERPADMTASLSGFQVDEGRGRLYETVEGGLQVLDAADMSVLEAIEDPNLGPLVGFDPVSDRLYFLAEGGGLEVRPVTELFN